ncbi:Actin-like protein arp9 (SWI/SNF complex component arp9) [Pichia californica]|uniref:Actin-like protein arp9 (SWI/SNF complex component arp9) n=1 Tax=Pichia californica TaxID=460514 RepID=A0A9P7BEM2_9ASCO|nr:Actin-like protein arp9 (SWI/SNF complex component arp9) [[Candida] californica]KAG0689492.1 Actin-like protein arp9 (SWI/SNF complex component arp9) [[Candida] californica]
MAPGYKEESYLILQPGSYRTLVKLGLEDPLGLPSHSIESKVYRKKSNIESSNDNNSEPDFYSITPVEGYEEIYPIVAGRIKDVKGLQFFIKSIITSLITKNENGINPSNSDITSFESINLLLVQSSTRWNPFSIESIINYLFESINLNSISLVPIELCSMFSYGSISNALIIDIGYEKSEILPIIDYQLYSPSKKVIDKGGSSINQNLIKLLPKFNNDQIEILKKSSIFECLSEEDAKKSFYGMEGLIENLDSINNNEDEDDDLDGIEKDDGILDIATIVTSEKSTRELLDETNKKLKKKGEQEKKKKNSELESNNFYDFDGNLLTVGKERFQGCNELIDQLVFNIYHSLNKIPDLKKRQDCYDNIIITGQTSKIKGFKEKIIFHLFNNYIVLTDNKLLQPQSQFRNDVRTVDDSTISQVPRHLKLVPKIEYFSEWKKNGFEDCSFLGAQILSKQVFNSNSELCLTRDNYNENGPMTIWNICL